MATNNPYQTPESKVAIDREVSPERFSCLAGGVKIISAAIVMYLLGTVVFFGVQRQFGILILLPAYLIGLAGFMKAINGVELKLYSKLLFGVSMFIPVMNILVLAHLGETVIRELRAAGYRVGLFGIKDNHAA